MVRIVSDTSTLYSTTQAKEAGFAVTPLSVTIGGQTYREFDEIDSETFVAKINEGNCPPAASLPLARWQPFMTATLARMC